MTYLEQNKAIYARMCEIAQDFFNEVLEKNENFRKVMQSEKKVTCKELDKMPAWHEAVDAKVKTIPNKFNDLGELVEHGRTIRIPPLVPSPLVTINVDGVKIETTGLALISGKLKAFRSLARGEDITFTCQAEYGELLAEFSMSFDDPNGAKTLAQLCINKSDQMYDVYRVFQYVMVEYDTETTAVNFVATNSHILGVITDDDDSIADNGHKTIRSLVSVTDWKAVCDAMRKTKQDAQFKFFDRKKNEFFENLTIRVGNVTAIGQHPLGERRYPNWRCVLPHPNEMRHYAISPEDRKEAQKWLSKLKKSSSGYYVSVSVYEGSNRIYFDLMQNNDDEDKQSSRSVSFMLTDHADRTEGIAFSLDSAKLMAMNGIWVTDKNHAALIEDANLDVLMAMPMKCDNVTFDVEQREMAVAIA